MNIQIVTRMMQDVECDVLIVAAAQQERGLALSATAYIIDDLLNGLISERGSDGEFTGRAGELLTLHPMKQMTAKRVLVVGLGKQEKVTPQSIRRASAIAARHAQSTGAHQIALALNWKSSSFDEAAVVQAQVEGAELGCYNFRKYQHEEQQSNGKQSTTLLLVSESPDTGMLQQAVARGQAMADATNFARDLVNEPPNVLTPSELANRAVAMAKQFGLAYEVFDQAKIEELQMGGLLGVSQGSAQPPQFVVLRYRGGNPNDKGMALVGKGITFDTGGISIKPAAGMDEMKGDMGGAAAVIGAMQAIAALKPDINVTGLVPTCENMPSGTAFRPGDILRIMNGKTIEIVNTDAEGRLILADALSYAVQEGLSPIIDLATLTGAMVVALGSTMTGFFCNDEQLSENIIAAGRAAGEKYWPMPLDEEYGERIKSDIADIKQTGGREAGAVSAAKILEHFVGNAQWAHLDIAGTGYVDSKKAYQEKGATGVGVRMLAELAFRLAKE